MIDLLYVTWNRLAFTEATFAAMLANTDWSLFERLVVYDDTSEDGTWEFLQEAINRVPVPVVAEQHEFRSPVAMMNHYLRKTEATWFCKVDNDIMLPPGWSSAMVGLAMEGGRPIDLLGMEAGHGGRPDPPDWDGRYGFDDSSHIGGVGMMRVEAFRRSGEMSASGRFGFTQYQIRHKLTRGWISPSLLVPSLDRVPIEPWVSLSDEYTEKGWQRPHPWPKYDPSFPIWWEWFTPKKKRRKRDA